MNYPDEALAPRSAWKPDGSFVKKALEGRPIRTIVEIGVDYGYSLFFLARLFPKASVLGVDRYTRPPKRPWEPYQGFFAWEWVKRWLPQHPGVLLLIQDSVDAAREYSGAPIDLLHIDGDHSIAGATSDFESWLPHVRVGGCVICHDTVTRASTVGKVFWRQPGTKVELNTTGTGHGIGLLVKTEET